MHKGTEQSGIFPQLVKESRQAVPFVPFGSEIVHLQRRIVLLASILEFIHGRARLRDGVAEGVVGVGVGNCRSWWRLGAG